MENKTNKLKREKNTLKKNQTINEYIKYSLQGINQ